jgi:RNA polymerase sigma-70 factor, ECF subfamily
MGVSHEVTAILAHSSAKTDWPRHRARSNSTLAAVPLAGRGPRKCEGTGNGHRRKAREGLRANLPTDDELIARLKAGEIAAFDLLVNRHQRRVHQLALGLMRNEHDAQEIVQEAFLRAYLGLNGFRGASSFYTWLHRIVFNLAIDAKRHPFRHRINWEAIAERADDTRAFDLPRVHNSDPHETFARFELNCTLNSALSKLNSFHRAVIVMREVEGMSYQEMADSLRISKGTVMSRLFHARRRLQQRLAVDLSEPQPAF